ncbi:hypothetical protein BDW02DRAFT_82042 [Decorospora gaudefroyi]|uniref:Uncharacterized protein n=1 Tax=Decorospora gaudefroyi TaxID=184978 RepID=A0A6A5KTN2_9PLEO|nr:hypothetical protein BDW02DRAFT_82042 [Decorospora gaudefroyi]
MSVFVAQDGAGFVESWRSKGGLGGLLRVTRMETACYFGDNVVRTFYDHVRRAKTPPTVSRHRSRTTSKLIALLLQNSSCTDQVFSNCRFCNLFNATSSSCATPNPVRLHITSSRCGFAAFHPPPIRNSRPCKTTTPETPASNGESETPKQRASYHRQLRQSLT